MSENNITHRMQLQFKIKTGSNGEKIVMMETGQVLQDLISLLYHSSRCSLCIISSYIRSQCYMPDTMRDGIVIPRILSSSSLGSERALDTFESRKGNEKMSDVNIV